MHGLPEVRRMERRRAAAGTAVVVVASMSLVGWGDCGTEPPPELSFDAGTYELTARYTACQSGAVVFAVTDTLYHCTNGPFEGAGLPCTAEINGDQASMTCTASNLPVDWNCEAGSATIDVEGPFTRSSWSFSGTISTSELAGDCVGQEGCLQVELTGRRIGDAPPGCQEGEGPGSDPDPDPDPSSNGTATFTIHNGPLAGQYTTTDVKHYLFDLGEDRYHQVYATVNLPSGDAILVTVETPSGVTAPGTFDLAGDGWVDLYEGTTALTFFYGDPNQTTGNLTIQSISGDSISGTFSAVVTGDYEDPSGSEVQSRTVSGSFSAESLYTP